MKVTDADATSNVVPIGGQKQRSVTGGDKVVWTHMGPGHPQWEEFLGRLEGKDGLNVTKAADDSISWECGDSYDLAETILIGDMGFGEDFTYSTIEFFQERGTQCDCEVLFNAETKFN